LADAKHGMCTAAKAFIGFATGNCVRQQCAAHDGACKTAEPALCADTDPLHQRRAWYAHNLATQTMALVSIGLDRSES